MVVVCGGCGGLPASSLVSLPMSQILVVICGGFAVMCGGFGFFRWFVVVCGGLR